LYISTVDSGNLAGHLLTLRAGLLALADDRILMSAAVRRSGDTLRILHDDGGGGGWRDGAAGGVRKQLETASAAPPATLAAARSQLERLASAAELASRIARPAWRTCRHCAESEEAQLGWAQALARQCQAATRRSTCWCRGWRCLGRRRATLAAQLAGRRARRPRCRPDPARSWQAGRRAAGEPRRCCSQTTPSHRDWLADLQRQVAAASAHAGDVWRASSVWRMQAGDFARMEYDFLFDKTRHLLSIGYNVDEQRVDSGYYDLLASEARLCVSSALRRGNCRRRAGSPWGAC
jgi:cyclic beta-1,2-glucan synthetase